MPADGIDRASPRIRTEQFPSNSAPAFANALLIFSTVPLRGRPRVASRFLIIRAETPAIEARRSCDNPKPARPMRICVAKYRSGT
jgi:hypothetical protein